MIKFYKVTGKYPFTVIVDGRDTEMFIPVPGTRVKIDHEGNTAWVMLEDDGEWRETNDHVTPQMLERLEEDPDGE